jgi:hypothetical protein
MPDFPNLGAVITKADVDTKGTGSYAADYVNWCRVAHLLHEHAPGWQFHLVRTADDGHVWQAPNGTAYVVGCFTGPDDARTPDFPQAIMDNRNNAIAFEKVTARDLTDAHRRCLCTASAAAFGLAWQLWARETIEDPHREEAAKPAVQQDKPKAAEPAKAAPKPASKKAAGVVFLTEEEVEKVKVAVKNYAKRDDLIAAFKKQFDIKAPRIADRIQFPDHKQFIDQYIADNPA